MMFIPKMKLGDILIKEGLITEAQLKEALDVQKLKGGIPLGEILVDMGVVDEEVLVEFLGKQFNLPFISANKELLSPDKNLIMEQVVNKEFIKTHNVLPLSRNMNILKVALTDPMDLMLIDNLRVMTGCEIQPVIVGKNLLLEVIKFTKRTTWPSAASATILSRSTASSPSSETTSSATSSWALWWTYSLNAPL